MNDLNSLFSDLLDQGKYLYRGLLMAVMLGAAYLFWKDNRGRIRERAGELLKQPWLVLFLLYTGYLITSTLFGRTLSYPDKKVLHYLFFSGNAEGNREIIENILLYIPYVFLMLQAFRPPKALKASTLLAAGTTLFTEISQLLFWLGEFQISDLIYNTVGGLLGWLLWKLVRLVFPGRDRRNPTSTKNQAGPATKSESGE